MMAKIFISYRRNDSAGHAGRIQDRLEQEFGRSFLFMDVDAIPLGTNFIKVLEEEVGKCGVLLAIIGAGWLDARDQHGNRRLDSPNDIVRIEIASALRRDIPVIPVLLDGTKIPGARDLPDDLKELAQRNGLDVRHASFHSDMDKLIRALKERQISDSADRQDAPGTGRVEERPAVVRLILCFDGTWNRPDANTAVVRRIETNVVRFHQSILKTGPDGSRQVAWYDTGIGTSWYDRVLGGGFGFGLDQKIQEGYRWLVENYSDPDPRDREVYILGFSRGAYTARCLVGMIRNVGLLTPVNAHRVEEAYALYRDRDDSADTDRAVQFRARYSREVEIRFLGVWDTVGALGIPLWALQWLNAAEYAFHDTELSRIVQNAAHAVAIDEHRVDYQVALWDPVVKPGQTVEQRWFAGANADVGGGYDRRLVSDVTVAWMQGKAAALGLAIDPPWIPAVGAASSRDPIHDSYSELLGGVYARTHPRFYRALHLAGGNEVLDPSVLERRQAGVGYAPTNPGFPR
jgi:uncharacterized protein (DUF2235 family)